jgi:hypothetical protein
MNKYVIWIALSILALSFAVVEGVVANVPEQFVQFNGLLTILSVLGVVVWSLKMQMSGRDQT